MRNLLRRSRLTLSAAAVLSASLSVLPNAGFGSFVSPAYAQDCHWDIGPFRADGGPRNEEWACNDYSRVEPRSYVAIAVSDSTLHWGRSWAKNSRREAELAAIADCRRNATDCKVVVWGQYRCLALAISRPEKMWGVDLGHYPETASSKAMAQCREGGGKSCAVVSHPCSEDE